MGRFSRNYLNLKELGVNSGCGLHGYRAKGPVTKQHVYFARPLPNPAEPEPTRTALQRRGANLEVRPRSPSFARMDKPGGLSHCARKHSILPIPARIQLGR